MADRNCAEIPTVLCTQYRRLEHLQVNIQTIGPHIHTRTLIYVAYSIQHTKMTDDSVHNHISMPQMCAS